MHRVREINLGSWKKSPRESKKTSNLSRAENLQELKVFSSALHGVRYFTTKLDEQRNFRGITSVMINKVKLYP